MNAAKSLLKSDRVLLIAHRGDSHAAPENTLPAFRSAIEVGVDGVELDYRLSADGAQVVFHDETLDRCTNARACWGGVKIPLAEKTLAELRTLDAGAWFGEKFRNTQIPLLEEAIDLIQAGSIPVIERKTGSAEALIQLLRSKQVIDKVVVIAFDWHFVAECRMHAPELVLVALGEKEVTAEKIKTIKAIGAQAVGWNQKHLTREGIEAMRAAGLNAWTWTVDDPERARWLVANGVQAITTNKPALIKKVLAEQSSNSGPNKDSVDA